VRVHVGTSGYSYKGWKGAFYPEDLTPDGFLAYYATKLRAVEINSTFYRFPSRPLLAAWAEQVPSGFLIAMKAPRKITHLLRLKDVAETAVPLVANARTLGDKLGPINFQLPPNFKKDIGRLRDFLAALPEGTRATFEFRHESWFDDEVRAALEAKRIALCVAETDDAEAPADDLAAPIESTTDWGYLRLRRTDYTEEALAAWAERLRAQRWSEAYVFMKHEGPEAARLALRLTDLFGAE